MAYKVDSKGNKYPIKNEPKLIVSPIPVKENYGDSSKKSNRLKWLILWIVVIIIILMIGWYLYSR